MRQLYAELQDFFARRLPDPQEAADATQRVFERAWAGAKGSDRALLFHIARGVLIDEYRAHDREQQRNRPVVGRFDNQFEDAPFQGAKERAQLLDPDGEWGTTESATYTLDDELFTDSFDESLRALDEPLRDAFILCELRGLSSREAAEVLGVSHITAQARRREAASIIRREITA